MPSGLFDKFFSIFFSLFIHFFFFFYLSKSEKTIVTKDIPISIIIEQQEPKEIKASQRTHKILQKLQESHDETEVKTSTDSLKESHLISSKSDDGAPPLEDHVSAGDLKGLIVKYPRRSIDKEEEGEVLVHVFKEKDLWTISILKSSGFDRLDNAALTALQSYDFSKHPLPLKVLFRFSLKER